MFSSAGLWATGSSNLLSRQAVAAAAARGEAGSRMQVSDCQSRALLSPKLPITQQGKGRLGAHQANPASQTSPSLSNCETAKDKKIINDTVWHSPAPPHCCCVEHLLTNNGARQSQTAHPSFCNVPLLWLVKAGSGQASRAALGRGRSTHGKSCGCALAATEQYPTSPFVRGDF